MEIQEIKHNVNCLLAAAGMRKEEGEQPVRLLLYHLLMTVSMYDNLSADERAVVERMKKRFKNFFSSKFSLKERKERAEKKKSPYNPLIKEKDFPQRIEKENIYIAAGANSDFEERREAFRQECLRLLTEDNEQRVADFFHHYSQPSKRGKMLFERKHYWDTESRLKLWMNRSYNVDNTSAALRLERLKARQGTNRVAQGVGLSEEEQRQRAAERERADREREAQHERDRQQAVSFEEWQRMREKEAEENAATDKNDASDETG